MTRKLSLMMLILGTVFWMTSSAYAGAVTCAATGTCDEATFSSVAPDALILLDLSDGMNKNPAGGANMWGSSDTCVATAACSPGIADTTDPNYGFSNNVSGDTNYKGTTGCNIDCSRLAIAKRAIFDVLDDDNNGEINSQDSTSLGIRFGLMRFRDGEISATDITPDYNAGSIYLAKPIAATYQSIFCGAAATGSCLPTSTCASGECVANETATGGSTLARALIEAKLYLNDHKAADSTAGECRQKFVILISTSSDDCYGVSCSGTCPYGSQCVGECGSPDTSSIRRQQTVLQAQALNTAGYPVYTVGFGESMPDYLKNTLQWVARYGGTDNPMLTNSGNPDSYNPSLSPANRDVEGLCGGATVANWYAKTNDPGYGVASPVSGSTSYPLSGYAFLAANAADLSYALKSAISTIRDQTYSFTRVSVQTVRTIDENYIYEASFTPLATSAGTVNDPFWLGHLKRYSINVDGSLAASADWDAGIILRDRATARTIYTYKGGSLVAFNNTYITKEDLGVASDTIRDGVITFVRGGDEAYNSATTDGAAKDNWKLGDIFHSSPISIGTPSPYFSDKVDTQTTKAYDTYRAANERTSANGKRLIVAGANDGQFHVFRTGNAGDGGGTELWSFIPPNLLTKLQAFYHSTTTLGGTHPPKTVTLTHEYFVDGPTTASDIWTGTGDGTTKAASEWKAYAIISEGRGGSSKLWCSSQYCDSGCTDTYSATNKYYCGYYAFDLTDTTAAPVFKWHFGGGSSTPLTATQGNHLGAPWSKITIGRVKIAGNERWVGFAAGGYAGTDCKTANNCSKCDKRGKGFYVIDMKTGQVLWTYTACGPDGVVDFNMGYSLSGQPASVDIDDDGFIETVYAADLGGNVWRFKMCTKTDDATCDTSDWTGGLFFATASGNIRPIYTKPTVVHTTSGHVWVYFGSGDVNDPTASNAQEKMYAVIDVDRTSTYGINNLKNITSSGSTFDLATDYPSNNGWYINLSGSGQKILADPTVYADVVYFTTYTPGNANKPCDKGGEADLGAVDYETGAGAYSGGERTTDAGSGIASGAVISENPYGGTDVYVTTSEGAKINPVKPPDPFANKANMQYWHDMRVQ